MCQLDNSLVIKSLFTKHLLKFISPIVIITVWECLARIGMIPPFILPAPTHILASLFNLIINGELTPHLIASLKRSLSGFIIGSCLGISMGMLIGWSKIMEQIFDIPVQVFRAVPTSALFPLIIVWFGIGEMSKIFIVALPPFFLCLVNTFSGVRGVDMVLIKAARSLGARDRHILKEIILPSSAPMIFAGLRLGIVVSLVLLILAEMVAAEKGLGFFILESQRFWLTEKMFAGIITITLLGFFFDRLILFIERKALSWRSGRAFNKK
jgi:ABC-type nitrate/sulfonate/bicarbonate transport system permease component